MTGYTNYDINGLNFSRVGLSGAKLSHAAWIDTDFDATDLSGVNMIGANITGTKFGFALLCQTIMPDGSVYPICSTITPDYLK